MTARPTAMTAGGTTSSGGERDEQASLVARLATRLRRGVRLERPDDGDLVRGPDHDLLTFARHQIASQQPIDGVDLADPLSLTADATASSVRVEFISSAGPPQPEPQLLEEVIAEIAPALFSDGRIERIEVGLVERPVGPRSMCLDAGAAEWAIVRLGDEHPC